ncbi:hypothetical protein [Microbacterium sp. DWRC1-3]|uniref:hypothetical protein n=1 Tax=Microbacterium sp. DWRC1-3 TaxID=2804630 RepID=UPI003CE953DC
MESRNPLVVVGVCTPERRSYAAELAQGIGGHLIPLVQPMPRPGPQPITLSPEHPSLATSASPLVVDVDNGIDLPHLAVASAPRSAVICVVDALHFSHDLGDGRPVSDVADEGDDRGDFGSRARRAVSHVEGATLVAFVNWETVPTAELSLLMAITSHLNPTARARLSRGPVEDLRASLDGGCEPLPCSSGPDGCMPSTTSTIPT